jgi:UDP-N-acetyl-D-mannosaminuronate dehydrogenase
MLKKLAVLGLGRVGLPLADVVFASGVLVLLVLIIMLTRLGL